MKPILINSKKKKEFIGNILCNIKPKELLNTQTLKKVGTR